MTTHQRPSSDTRGAAHPGRLLAALLGAMFLGNVDIAVTNTATPSIQAGLHASGAQLELVASGYTLAYATMLVPGARLGHARSRRGVFLLGMAGFTLTSLACGLAPDAWSLVVARVLQGAAAALMVAQVLTGIQVHFTGEARARALGWYAVVLSGSAVLGQLLGGVIVSADLLGLTWRPAFLVNVPLGVALLLAAVRTLPRDRPERRTEVDVAAVAVLSVSLLLVVVPLVLGRERGWPWWVPVSLVLGLLGLGWLARFEHRRLRRGRDVLVNVRLLRRGPVALGLLSGGLGMATYFGVLFVLALYLQQGLGRSAAFSGTALVPWVAAFGLTGPVLGRASEGVRRYAATYGGLLLTLAFTGVATDLLVGDRGTVLLVVLLGVGGLGFGAMFSGTLAQLTGAVSVDHASDVSGLFNTATRLGGVIGVAVLGTVYLAVADGPGPAAAVHGFTVTTIAMAVTALVAAACSWRAARG